jgi:hypothetical protein
MSPHHLPSRLAPLTVLLAALAAATVAFPAAAASVVAATPAMAPAPATVWVSPRQTIALLNQPVAGAMPGLTVASGDALTVLTQQGEFLQVRTETGASGWIKRSHLSETAPTPAADLTAENARLDEQVRTLDAQLRAFQEESLQLRNRMRSLEAELAAATRPVPLTASGLWGLVQRLAVDARAWGALGILLLALLLAFRAGVEHRNKDIRARLGGLDL